MKIKEITEKGDDGSDYGLTVELITDTYNNSVEFREGEPEDMSLSRDLSDVYNISTMLKEAYEAGKRNEIFEIEYSESEE